MYNLGVWVEINIAEMADNLILNDSSTEIEVEFVSEEELILFDRLVNEAQNEADGKMDEDSKPSCQDSGKPNSRLPAPMEWLRGGLGYISVSDLTAQSWCEQQMEYSYTFPPSPASVSIQQGSSIHLARELELYNVVEVETASKEDKWAIVCLNCITHLATLDARQKVRELPVFGKPLGMGMFIYGIIDEIGFNEKGEIELLELKTRASSNTLPSKSQQIRTQLQVMLYMKLFNDVLCGNIDSDDFVNSLGLSRDKKLSEDPITFATRLGISCINFGDILNSLFTRLQYSDISTVKSAVVEYCAQEDCHIIQRTKVELDEKWLKSELERMLPYWRGERPTTGVDVEEAWKCQRCSFADICVWRANKEEECRKANIATKGIASLEKRTSPSKSD